MTPRSPPHPRASASSSPAPRKESVYALAREFLARGDRVCICGRSATRVDAAVAALRAEFPGACVAGARCDVTDPRDVDAFGDYAASTIGVVHHWLNNAGMVSSREPLFDVEPAEVVRVCNTNLTGAILCCQKAVRLMRRQDEGSAGGSRRARESNGSNSPQRYHVYNFGFSQWGASFSKSTCTHKATKRGLSQLTASLSEELLEAGVDSVGVHQLSPGMVLTDLLLEGASPVARRFFNVLAEEPEVVAADLCPKIRETVGTRTAIEFLTLPDALARVMFGVPQIVGGAFLRRRWASGRVGERGGVQGERHTPAVRGHGVRMGRMKGRRRRAVRFRASGLVSRLGFYRLPSLNEDVKHQSSSGLGSSTSRSCIRSTKRLPRSPRLTRVSSSR